MATWGSHGILVPTELCVFTAAAAGETVTTGHAPVAAISYTGSNVSSNLEKVADIDNPSAWTTLVSITGGPLIIGWGTNPASHNIQVDSAEDAGEALRMQVIIDGTTALDIKCVKDTIDTQLLMFGPILGNYISYTHILHCNSSFVIKACCKADAFAISDTQCLTPVLYYWKATIM